MLTISNSCSSGIYQIVNRNQIVHGYKLYKQTSEQTAEIKQTAL